MKNNQPIVRELVTAIEICCRQINTMTEITGRTVDMNEIQKLIDRRVDEFKLLYPEIPRTSAFTVENNIDGLLFINSNQVFRDYVDQTEIENNPPPSVKTASSFRNNTLH